jgi:hypothetical protein
MQRHEAKVEVQSRQKHKGRGKRKARDKRKGKSNGWKGVG